MFKSQGWQRSARLLAVSSVLLLAACGGGGGGSDNGNGGGATGDAGNGETYTVTPVVGAHGTISPSGAQQVPAGGHITFNVTPDSGWKIESSVTSGDTCFSKATPNTSTATGVYTFSNLSGDCSFTVDFERTSTTPVAQYTVTPTVTEGVGHGSIDPPGAQTVGEDGQITFTTTPDAGYEAAFDELCDTASNSTSGNTYTIHSPTGDCSFTVKFTPVVPATYTVTPVVIEGSGHGSVSPSGAQVVSSGGQVTFMATPDAGYSVAFGNLCATASDSPSGNAYTVNSPSGDCSFEVKFVHVTHTVTPVVTDGSGHGSIMPSGPQAVSETGSITFTATPDAGYSVVFDNLCATASGSPSGNSYTVNSPTGDCSFDVKFAPITHTVTPVVVEGAGHGSIDPSAPQTVNEDGQVIFTATPDSGYSVAFGNLCTTASGSPTGNIYIVSEPTGDCSFEVKFTPVTHAIAADVVSGVMPLGTPMLTVSGSPDYSVVDSSNQYLWVVDGNNDHSSGSYDPGSDKLSVYKIGTDGSLSLLDSVSAPYVAADCGAGTTSNALSSYCMVAGPQGSAAAGYVYVRFNDDCSDSPCGAPSVHRYHLVNDQIVDAGTWDIAPAVSGATVNGVDVMAIDPSGTHFYVGSRQSNLPNVTGTRFVVAAYAIGAGGALGTTSTAAVALNEAVEDVDGLAFYSAGTNLYAYLVFSGQGELNSNPGVISAVSGILYYSVDGTGDITAVGNVVWDSANLVINALAVDPQGSAYIAAAFPGSIDPSVTNVYVERVSISTDGSLDTANMKLVAPLSGARVRSLAIDPNRNFVLVGYADVVSGSNGSWDTAHVGVYGIEPDGSLILLTGFAEAVNGGYYVQNLAMSADGKYAYLMKPNQGVINQYLIGTTHGEVTPATQDVNEGGSASVTVTPDTGYQAVVSDDGCSGSFNSVTGSYDIANLVADCTVTATFVAE